MVWFGFLGCGNFGGFLFVLFVAGFWCGFFFLFGFLFCLVLVCLLVWVSSVYFLLSQGGSPGEKGMHRA